MHWSVKSKRIRQISYLWSNMRTIVLMSPDSTRFIAGMAQALTIYKGAYLFLSLHQHFIFILSHSQIILYIELLSCG